MADTDTTTAAVPSPSGGLWDKLGNHYEGIWSVGRMFDLLEGEINTIEFEPLVDGRGIEFRITRLDGTYEFHSAKRQAPGNSWTLYELSKTDPKTGRSTLGDLLEKLERHPGALARFVSGSSSMLQDLRDRRFRQCQTFEDFRLTMVEADQKYLDDFTKYIQGERDAETAYNLLCRLESHALDEATLEQVVDRRIRYVLCQTDGKPCNPQVVRFYMAGKIVDFLRRTMAQDDVQALVTEGGFAERRLTDRSSDQAAIRSNTDAFMQEVDVLAVGGKPIPRDEASQIIALVSADCPSNVFVQGTAGQGKSFVLAQVVQGLREVGLPVLILRLDCLPDETTADALGLAMGLAASPVHALCAVASPGPCVLVLDQVDAVSQASGRNPRLWTALNALLADFASMEGRADVRLVMACRSFDVENDARIRALCTTGHDFETIELENLATDVVREVLREAEYSPASFSDQQLEVLRLPENLFLFLQSSQAGRPVFSCIHQLYEGFWDVKCSRCSQTSNGTAQWYELVQTMTDYLSRNQILAAPGSILDPYQGVDVLCRENVLVRRHGMVRFFHEGFFDYAYARFFAAAEQTLVQLLRGG
ncbi:MAG: ATP-binding protein, partial [Verrucomicrobia bacterium]|nr:ATP-binding protein [Verrucomicrobiota bacterium]